MRAVTAVKLIVFDRETFGRWLSQSPASKTELRRMAYQRRGSTKPLPSAASPASPPPKCARLIRLWSKSTASSLSK
ncbi:MAG: hypothetical protein M5U34_12235 [Chloroflexi bacterium]|nr:hypothetical protein [Chloroflexota bacterium]